MSFGRGVLIYALTVPVFFAIDLIWLGLVARGLYRRQLGDLMADSPNWPVAVLFYLLYIVGIVVFAIIPGWRDGSMVHALGMGALFGFLAYATYDLTNLATLRDWPATLAVVDITWGTVLTGITATIGYHIARWLA
jgi:uncharacterized membrane protein